MSGSRHNWFAYLGRAVIIASMLYIGVTLSNYRPKPKPPAVTTSTTQLPQPSRVMNVAAMSLLTETEHFLKGPDLMHFDALFEGGPLKAPFAALSGFTIKDPATAPTWITKLDDQEVVVAGFMSPQSSVDGRVTHFILTQNVGFFLNSGPAAANELMSVTIALEQAPTFYDNMPVVVQGRLFIGPSQDQPSVFYRLTAESIEPAMSWLPRFKKPQTPEAASLRQ